MKKINIYVGLNVQNLKFECGGGPVGFEPGIVRYSSEQTHRALPENGLHPTKAVEAFIDHVNYCKDNFDLNVSTHSESIVNSLGLMIHSGKVSVEQVNVFVLSEDNQKIEHHSTFDPKGFLVNWPYGFFDFDPKITMPLENGSP